MVAAAELPLRDDRRVNAGETVTSGAAAACLLRLAPGVALHATSRGLVARAAARCLRFDLRDRGVEAQLVASLSHGVIDPDGFPAAAVRALSESGVLVVAGARAIIVDRSGTLGSLEVVEERRVDAADFIAASVPDGWTIVLAGAPDDPLLGRTLVTAVEAGKSSITAWIDESGVAVARDDGLHRGCAHCAWLMDAALARYVPTMLAARGAVVGHAIGDATALGRMASSMVQTAVHDPAARPRAGEVWTFERATALGRAEPITPHPACPCSARPPRPSSNIEPLTWASAEARRHAPVWPVERAAENCAARVVVRSGREGWVADPSSLVVALAAGPDADDRALGEAVERFCFFHAPSDVVDRSATELGAETLDHDAVATLLFRQADYLAIGFRFRPFASDERIEWCRAVRLDGRQAAFVPSSLVGRVRRGGRPLVDATTNGYACHPDRERAIERALLELVERDAVLLAFDVPLAPPPRIVGGGEPDGTLLLLVTQDIDLPVVVAMAPTAAGSVRCGSAAALTIEDAIARALTELRVALTGREAESRPSDTFGEPRRRHLPEDHLAWWAGTSGREEHQRLLSVAAPERTVDELRARWPSPVDAPTAIAEALARCGLAPWIVDRSLPAVFGPGWFVVRALVPGLVELAWGLPYRRLATPRVSARLAAGAVLSPIPHPIA